MQGKYNSYLSFLLSGDKRGCSNIVKELLEKGISVYDLYINLFQDSMYQVGRMWENNEISVAVEHMATSITESLLHLVYPIIFSAEHIDKAAVVACVPNEYHQIGAKMVADIFELNGWDGFFLGANTPSDELLRMLDDKKPDLLALSMSIYFSLPHLEETVQKVRNSFPQLDIIVGGQGFLWGGRDVPASYTNVNYVGSILELERLIKS